MSSVFPMWCPKCLVFPMLCPKCLQPSLCGVRNVFSLPYVVSEMSSAFLMLCPKCLQPSLCCVRNVSCLPYVVPEMSSVFPFLCPKCLRLPYVVPEMSSAFLIWCPKCLLSSLCDVLSGSFTIYSLRKIGLIRTVMNVACMQVGLLIRATCLGRTAETNCQRRSKHYNTVHNTCEH